MKPRAKTVKTKNQTVSTDLSTNQPVQDESEPTMTTQSRKSIVHTAPAAELTPSNPSAKVSPVIFQKGPPADALIPTPPIGFKPASDSIFLGTLPRLVELGALPGAIEDLKEFLDYTAVLGATVPPLAEVIAALQIGSDWSSMRKASSAWDAYAQMQEGIAWSTVRPLMDTLRPAFALALSHNSSLATKFANLNTLLTAKQSISRKGAATRALNKKAIAEGKPPIHGKAGKRRKKAADKVIVAAAAANGGASTTAPTTVTTTAAPAVSVTAAPSTTAAVAEAPATASNGAAHS